MTRNKATNALSHRFQKDELIFFDANVWLFLYPPPGASGSGWTKDYTKIFKSLVAAEAVPVTDAIIIGEYLNRYFRLEYEGGWRTQYTDFKKFRNSPDFQFLAEDAIADAGEILKFARIQDTPLASLDMEAILTETKAGNLDFNDAVIVESCRHHGWRLLTHDGDCRIGGIEVLTTNPKLLRMCP